MPILGAANWARTSPVTDVGSVVGGFVGGGSVVGGFVVGGSVLIGGLLGKSMLAVVTVLVACCLWCFWSVFLTLKNTVNTMIYDFK